MADIVCRVCLCYMGPKGSIEDSEAICWPCQRRACSPHIKMWGKAKQRAKEKGVPFTIKRADVIIPTHCPVLGLRLQTGGGTGKFGESSPTLDRIIPELGYVPGNVAVISWRANRIKNDGTADELQKIADWIRDNSPVC